jgi:hypothetical protein
MKSLVKELFIGVLLLMVIVFTLGILFYDSMPNNKATPTSITYTADTAVTTTIQQISEEKANSTSNSSSSSNSSGLDIGSVIASYSIGSTDLSTYAQRKTYESGKVDPFEDYKEETNTDGNTTGGNNNSTGNNNSSNSNSSSNSNNGNSNNNGSSKNDSSTGKLFENKNSK